MSVEQFDFCVGRVVQRFRLVRPGTFIMKVQTPPDDDDDDDRYVEKMVSISKPFWIGDSPVTQEFWEEVMGGNPSFHKGPQNPVEMVSWYDCLDFLSKLNVRFPLARFLLPTEEEWEHACGALHDGWFEENSNGQTHPVKQKAPNSMGLYDMLGNVWEWTSSRWSWQVNRDAHIRRIIRGGSYVCPPAYPAKSIKPDRQHPDLGIRLVVTAHG